MNIEAPYGITKRLATTSIDAVRERLTSVLATEGFGVLTEIDMQKTLRAKIGAEIEPYLILGACNPKLAHTALTRDPSVGLLLPCNVVVTQDGPDVVVSVLSPAALFGAIGAREELRPIAHDAEQRVRRVVEKL